MTFGEFNTAVQYSVSPDGIAENLVSLQRSYAIDALIDLQTKVPCLQQNHTDYLCASASFYSCGASLFEAPRGFIRSLSTMVPGDTCCREVRYTPVSMVDMQCMLKNQEAFSFCSATELHPYTTYLQDGVYVPFPDTPLECVDYVGPNDTSLDKSSRAIEGFFSIDRGQIWVTPQIQSNELVKLEWDGRKTIWSDTDTMDEEIFNREVQECVEMFVRSRMASTADCDYTRAIFFSNENMQRPGQYQVRRADLIHWCEKTRRPPKRDYCWDTTCSGGMFLGTGTSSSSSSGSSTSQGTQVFFGTGDPNGVVTATTSLTSGAIFYTATGAMWFKIGVGTSNTGWEKAIA